MSFYLKFFFRRASVQLGDPAENWKKSEGTSVKLSLHTLSAILERTECKSRFLPEIADYISHILELMNKLFSTIRLSGHIKSSFDIFIEKVLPNIQKRFASSRKNDKQFCGVSNNFFPWERSSGHLECRFTRFSDKFWGENHKRNQIKFFVFKNKQ